MLLGDAKPIMIFWMPVFNPLTGFFGKLIPSFLEKGLSWVNDTVGFVEERTKEHDKVLMRIPLPFYFYERLGNDKENSDFQTGFLLDAVSESVDLTYPDAPSSPGNEGDSPGATLLIRNTVDIAFRVKMNSTIVSVLRLLLKKLLTSYKTAGGLRVSFIWNEYIMMDAKVVDYNEDPITGSDLTMMKIKLETVHAAQDVTSKAGKLVDLPAIEYVKPVAGV